MRSGGKERREGAAMMVQRKEHSSVKSNLPRYTCGVRISTRQRLDYSDITPESGFDSGRAIVARISYITGAT